MEHGQRVFIAGATGVIGSRLVPLLVEAGHLVGGLTRTEQKAALVRRLGGEPIVCDVYDPHALAAAVRSFRPDVIIHELTDLPDDLAELPARRDANARIRVEGTRNLVAAAEAAGTTSLLAQSVAWDLPPGPGADAVATLEKTVLDFGGVVLRYGQFYGPGTFYPEVPPTDPASTSTSRPRRRSPHWTGPPGSSPLSTQRRCVIDALMGADPTRAMPEVRPRSRPGVPWRGVQVRVGQRHSGQAAAVAAGRL